MAILFALQRGDTRRAAAAAGGIHRDTLTGWLKVDAAFLADVERAEDTAESRYLAVIEQAAQSGTAWQAAAWWLERRKHEDYARRDKSEMTIDVKREAERIAAASGLNADEIIAEAERVLAGRR